jgi:S-adenosylmethionine:tRNA ribosyltransferase-isomerase
VENVAKTTYRQGKKNILSKRRNKNTKLKIITEQRTEKGKSKKTSSCVFCLNIKNKNMKLSQFKFNLPDELIAKYPANHRDESRLLVARRKTGELEHRTFKDILEYFNPGDFFIFNNTKVFPARLFGNKEKTGAKIEVFLLRELNPNQHLWDVLVNPARKIRIGNKLYFGENEELVAEVIDNTTSRGRTLRFLYDGESEEFKKRLFAIGETPIPEYMGRDVEPEDAERYQSIFATNEGAVVAPAAGLHFSRELMKRMEIKDIEFDYLTVHNGLGAYRTIDVEDLTKHKMESEQMIITQELCERVNKAKDKGRNICVVGASVLRAVETTVSTDGHLKPKDGWTNKFIFPPYDFTLANSLITNFHMPYSTLLMMACAFGGYEKMMNVYGEAMKEGYRFGAYGDVMLIVD